MLRHKRWITYLTVVAVWGMTSGCLTQIDHGGKTQPPERTVTSTQDARQRR